MSPFVLTGDQLRGLADYYGELLEDRDTLVLEHEPDGETIAATASYADGTEGDRRLYEAYPS